MANSRLSPAKVTLLAVQAAIRADIGTLRTLTAKHPKTLHNIILRILLTFLPESLDSSEYIQFLLDYDSGQICANGNDVDTSPIEGISTAEASKKVRKLRLLPLRIEKGHQEAPEDPLILFLIHRAYRIDEQTGLITQLPELIAPFLDRSEYLRNWMLGTVLPLLRLNYEYHPIEERTQSIEWFESLDVSDTVEFLLSRTVQTDVGDETNKRTIVRDLRCLAGPWLYGNNQWKRQRLSLSAMEAQTIAPLNNNVASRDSGYRDWDAVFAWIISQNSASYTAVSEAIAQWDGAEDVDLGGYGDSNALLSEEDRRQIDKHYGHCALTAAFLIPEESLPALAEAHRILNTVISRLTFPAMTPLHVAAAMLAPVPDLTEDGKSARERMQELISYLRNEEHTFSDPAQVAVDMLQAVLTSSYLLLKSGTQITIERTGSMLLHQSEGYQYDVLQTYLNNTASTAGADDKLWIRARNEILWLHDWGMNPASEGATTQKGRGVLGQLDRNLVEKTILNALLSHTRKLKSPCPGYIDD